MKKETNQILIKKISDFFAQAKKSQAIVSLSGGIDSAYSAMLHVAALGKENVLLINLPSRHNSKITKTIAQMVANNLGCQYVIMNIDKLVDLNQEIIKNEEKNIAWQVKDRSDENTQARVRANVTASLAAKYNALFPCNANRSELVIGYGTLYGDLTGYACPLGSLWKSEIYEQAKLLSDIMGGILPAAIFTVHASAELGPHQDVDKNLGDPMTDDYHEKLLKFWSAHYQVNPNLYKMTAEAVELEKLADLLNLNAAEKILMEKLLPTKIELMADMEYLWHLFTTAGQFKKNQIPPVFYLD